MAWRWIVVIGVSLWGLGLAALSPALAGERPDSAPSGACDRACLYDYLDQYLTALEDQDPWRLPWADHARFTENNVLLPVGDGLWGTITGLSDYRLRFADPKTGHVGFFGAVEEPNATSPFAMRMKVTDGKIREVETLVRRAVDDPMSAALPAPQYWDKPILKETLPEEKRIPRARLISLADGYFDTLQLNDGTLFTRFADNCERVENGVKTTNNPELADVIPVAKLGCAAQFELGNFRYDDRLRGRRYPLVDEERGLVLAAGFIDHKGDLGHYRLTDGTMTEALIRRPHSFYLMELFKINAAGEIRQIEAVFLTVPYRMASPWTEKGE